MGPKIVVKHTKSPFYIDYDPESEYNPELMTPIIVWQFNYEPEMKYALYNRERGYKEYIIVRAKYGGMVVGQSKGFHLGSDLVTEHDEDASELLKRHFKMLGIDIDMKRDYVEPDLSSSKLVKKMQHKITKDEHGVILVYVESDHYFLKNLYFLIRLAFLLHKAMPERGGLLSNMKLHSGDFGSTLKWKCNGKLYSAKYHVSKEELQLFDITTSQGGIQQPAIHGVDLREIMLQFLTDCAKFEVNAERLEAIDQELEKQTSDYYTLENPLIPFNVVNQGMTQEEIIARLNFTLLSPIGEAVIVVPPYMYQTLSLLLEFGMILHHIINNPPPIPNRYPSLDIWLHERISVKIVWTAGNPKLRWYSYHGLTNDDDALADIEINECNELCITKVNDEPTTCPWSGDVRTLVKFWYNYVILYPIIDGLMPYTDKRFEILDSINYEEIRKSFYGDQMPVFHERLMKAYTTNYSFEAIAADINEIYSLS